MMRFTEDQVVASVRQLSPDRLRLWVERGWVRPQTERGPITYSEVDVARVSLLCELHHELDIGEEELTLIVSLIDQIHGLRHQLRTLGRAIEAQPQPVRNQIKQVFRELAGE